MRPHIYRRRAAGTALPIIRVGSNAIGKAAAFEKTDPIAGGRDQPIVQENDLIRSVEHEKCSPHRSRRRPCRHCCSGWRLRCLCRRQLLRRKTAIPLFHFGIHTQAL